MTRTPLLDRARLLGVADTPRRGRGRGWWSPVPASCRVSLRGTVVVCLAAAMLAWAARSPGQNAVEDDAIPADESGVFLPGDRIRERQFERAGELLANGRWSDAAALFDEILEAERDAFLQGSADDATRRSLKAETWRAMQSQPPPGREAYELLFGARAERDLGQALGSDDAAGVVAVARRWFHTPAGRRAALIAALGALESDEPALAASWLERIASAPSAADLEPTVSLMRAVALYRAGDAEAAVDLLGRIRFARPARVGARDVASSMTRPEAIAWLEQMGRGRGDVAIRADWCQPRGTAGRNAVAVASRPLLVPRYRVPLTRHPEEARMLERQRRAFADGGLPPMPAGSPLAVDGLVVLRTGLGILAIDFESGKRVWLQASGSDRGPVPLDADPDAADGTGGVQATLARVFDDATSGGLVAADGLIIAVESPAEAFAVRGGQPEFGLGGGGFGLGGRRGQAWQGGNRLTAYDAAARGRLRWRLPRGDDGDVVRPSPSTTWYLGAPLVVGHELYVLVEEKGEIRLDVLEAATGSVRWSQPLAELDVEQMITSPGSRGRRLAGLSPALADGVLVCPLGAGAVVAIDIATRTLLWAHRYDRASDGVDEATRRERAGGGPDADIHIFDSLPVISRGRVLVAPYDGAGVICLDLREGTPVWQEAMKGRALVLGATSDRAIVLTPSGVEARSLEAGRVLWRIASDAIGGRPSGRGILTADRLLLPCDTPEVVEIALADGAIVARCPARAGAVPGNLVAYRGEIISRGIDSLDVFHQSAALESRIEAARIADPDSRWALEWQGQVDLERGDVAAGLEKIRAAARDATVRLPPSTLADAVVFGLRRDFGAAAASWRDALRPDVTTEGDPPPAARTAIRAAIEGFMKAGDMATAWAAMRELLAFRSADSTDPTLVRDPGDPGLTVEENRWIAGRLVQLVAAGGDPVRQQVIAFTDRLVEPVLAAGTAGDDPAGRVRRLETLAARFAGQPAGRRARQALAEALEGSGADEASLRRDVQRAVLARLDGVPTSAIPATAAPSPDGIWPLGTVVPRRLPATRSAGEQARRRWLPSVVSADLGDGARSLRLAVDLHDGRLAVFDDVGRHLVDLAIDTQGHPVGGLWMPGGRVEASAFGRMLYVHSGSVVSGFDLLAPGSGGRPAWTRPAAPGTPRAVPALAWGRMGGGRVARNGAVPLGMRVTEPGGMPRGESPRGGRVTARGVLHHDGASLMLLDHVDGGVLWERHLGHPVSELVCDDDFACACTPDGDGSTVVSMIDGRLVRTCTVPNRRQRIATSGRRIVSVVQPEGSFSGEPSETVRIEAIDPVTLEREVFGEFPGRSRTVMDGAERLLVLAPDGTLTALECGRGRVFVARLPEMPTRFEHLHVVSVPGRHLVVAGAHEPGDLEQAAAAQIASAGEDLTPPLSGAIWSVDRSTGEPLWPAPATIERHAIPLHQPADLPILLLVRRHPDREIARSEVVCLDARTGHALFQQDVEHGPQHGGGGFELAGNPDDGTIALVEAATGRRIELAFTGAAIPPQSPFRVSARRPADTPGMRARLLERLAPVLGPPR